MIRVGKKIKHRSIDVVVSSTTNKPQYLQTVQHKYKRYVSNALIDNDTCITTYMYNKLCKTSDDLNYYFTIKVWASTALPTQTSLIAVVQSSPLIMALT